MSTVYNYIHLIKSRLSNHNSVTYDTIQIKFIMHARSHRNLNLNHG